VDNLTVLTAAPILNVQLILDGVLIGAIFTLAAYGLALVWGVMNLKNLAQGDLVMLGGYVAWWLSKHGVHPILGLPVAAVLLFGFGWVLYFTVISRVIHRDLFTSLLATFGVALVLSQLMNVVFGSDVRTAESGFGTMHLFGGMVTLSKTKLVALVLAGIVAALVVAFMRYSRMGQAIRATAQDPRAARVLGVDTERVYAFTFGLNAAICGAAGALISMIWVIQPFYGIPHTIRSFVIVTAAGLGNLPGVIVAALGLGVAEQYSGFLLGAQLQQFTVVFLLVAVLVWRQFLLMRHRQVLQ
jgi:branched-chain amino acid transport system permease protein